MDLPGSLLEKTAGEVRLPHPMIATPLGIAMSILPEGVFSEC